MARVLSVIASEGFQQVEYLESKKGLEESGHTVVTCCTHQVAFDKAGHSYKVDALLDEVFEDEYDAILFVGGPGIYTHFDDADFHSMARAFFDSGKITAAICAAPVILARAGLLKGKNATCFEGQADELRKAEAEYTGEPITEDGLIITADGPSSAYDFGLILGQRLLG